MADHEGRTGADVAAGAATAVEPQSGPVQSAAARLDALIDAWSSTPPGSQLTELVRVRGLLGVGPLVEGDPGDALLAAAASRCDAVVDALQTAGGSSEEIVMFRRLSGNLRSWLDTRWPPSATNLAVRDNAIAMATALITGQVLPMDRGGLPHR